MHKKPFENNAFFESCEHIKGERIYKLLLPLLSSSKSFWCWFHTFQSLSKNSKKVVLAMVSRVKCSNHICGAWKSLNGSFFKEVFEFCFLSTIKNWWNINPTKFDAVFGLFEVIKNGRPKNGREERIKILYLSFSQALHKKAATFCLS